MAKYSNSILIKGIRILFVFSLVSLFVITVVGVLFSLIFYFTPYSEKVKIILTNTNNEHLIDVFGETPYRIRKLNIITGVIAGFNVLLSVFSLVLFKFRKQVVDKFILLLSSIKNLALRQYSYYLQWPLFERSILFVLFVLFVIFKIYLFLELPPFLDEVGTYLHFSSKGILTSASYYPIPNNHILNSVLTSISIHLPIDILLGMRIPPLLFSIIYFVGLLKLLGSIFMDNQRAILISMIICCFLPPVSSFGCLSRGYIYVLTFYIIQLNMIIYLVKGIHVRSALMLYVAAGVAGNYAIPTHLYSIIVNSTIAFCILLFSKRWHDLTSFFIANLILGVLSIVSYMPVFMVSGINSIINNPFTKPKGIHYVIDNLFTFWNNWLGWSLGINNVGFLLYAVIILVVIQIVFMNKLGKRLSIFLMLNLLLYTIIFLLHGTIPFNRNLIYVSIPLGLCLSYGIILIKWNRISFCIMGVLILSSFVVNSLRFHKIEFKEDYSAKKLIETLEAFNWHLSDMDTIYSQNLYYLETIVDFEHLRHGAKKELVILPYVKGIDSCNNVVFKKYLADNLNKNCTFKDEEYCVVFCLKNLK